MNCPYRKLALERWGIEPSGHGRYALVSRKDGVAVAVYLTDNETAAKASQPFYDSRVFDLKPVDFDKIRDVYDPEEKRRERRERAEQSC